MMNILAFDTCFDACSVAVHSAETGGITTERELMRRGHAEVLLPMIERTMKAAGVAFNRLDRIAVTHGPGTFTGARVGMSAALGASFAHALPVVTYSSLQCVARAAIEALGDEVTHFEGVLVARDAKRDSVFVEVTDMAGDELDAPALLSVADARQVARSRRLFALGSGAPLLAGDDGAQPGGLTTDWPAQSPLGIAEPDARFLLQDAASRTPAQALVPLYLRAPDATPSSRLPLARLVNLPAADA